MFDLRRLRLPRFGERVLQPISRQPNEHFASAGVVRPLSGLKALSGVVFAQLGS
jgi:hypothetical protein